MNPIETSYNGYNFRSRLEAKWAVFFDEINVEYVYELEGYPLHYNGNYLPDFQIDNRFIEIKPIKGDVELLKPIELSMALKQDVIIIKGDPLEYSFQIATLSQGAILHFNEDCYLNFQSWEIISDIHPHKEEAAKARGSRFEFGETPLDGIDLLIKKAFNDLREINFGGSLVSPRTRNFLMSLAIDFERTGSLSPKQTECLIRNHNSFSTNGLINSLSD